MQKKKDKKFAFRVSENDLNKIRIGAKKARMTVTDYLVTSALGKEIVVIDGVDNLLRELKSIGKNLNQLTTLANMGRISSVSLEQCIDKFGAIYAEAQRLTNRIPNEHFRLLSSEYTVEQAVLREKLPKLEERLEQLQHSLTNVARFIDKAKRYENLTELTPEILRLFVAKITVGEKAQKYSRTAEQEICIYYRDIGLMDTVEEAVGTSDNIQDNLIFETADTDPAA